MTDLRGMTLIETEAAAVAAYYPRYRGEQVFVGVHRFGAGSLDEITTLPKSFRVDFARDFNVCAVELIKKPQSRKENVTKYLFRLENSVIIESVLMRQPYGVTACVSSQAGCGMGCAFCASAVGGKLRDLTAGEMCAQVYEMQKDAAERIGNVVIMGMGEPLENYAETVRFIRLMNEPKGQNMSARNITLSTCGLIGGIKRLMKEGLKITLAVSLHAPNDDIRRRIMPAAKGNPLDALIEAAGDYAQVTGRRVTFEYALIKGLNDLPEHAAELAEKIKNGLFHVNVIPLNPVEGKPFEGVGADAAEAFAKVFTRHGVNATVRVSRGGDVNAACGQLRKGNGEW